MAHMSCPNPECERSDLHAHCPGLRCKWAVCANCGAFVPVDRPENWMPHAAMRTKERED